MKEAAVSRLRRSLSDPQELLIYLFIFPARHPNYLRAEVARQTMTAMARRKARRLQLEQVGADGRVDVGRCTRPRKSVQKRTSSTDVSGKVSLYVVL